MITKPFGRVLLCVALFASASVQAVPPPCLQLADGWARQPRHAAMPMAAGYGRLVNVCNRAQTVVSASSPLFGEVSIHETVLVDGVSRMRPVERLTVPANGTLTLAPGGLHLMLMQGGAPLAEGQQVPLALQLNDGAAVQGELHAAQTAP